jgi:hypothetical protein
MNGIWHHGSFLFPLFFSPPDQHRFRGQCSASLLHQLGKLIGQLVSLAPDMHLMELLLLAVFYKSK